MTLLYFVGLLIRKQVRPPGGCQPHPHHFTWPTCGCDAAHTLLSSPFIGQFTLDNAMVTGAQQTLRMQDVHNYWKWYMWLDPLHYAWTALVLNQYDGSNVRYNGQLVPEFFDIAGVHKWGQVGCCRPLPPQLASHGTAFYNHMWCNRNAAIAA